MTEPEVPFDEKLASPEGIERTPRTSTSFLSASEVCDFTLGAAINMRTTIAAINRVKSLITIGPFRVGAFQPATDFIGPELLW